MPGSLQVRRTGELAADAVEAVVRRAGTGSIGVVAVDEALLREVGAGLAARGVAAELLGPAGLIGPVTLVPSALVKGLEFDGVVVVNPAEILDCTHRGARLLYVAMTRAVQSLHMVGDAHLDL